MFTRHVTMQLKAGSLAGFARVLHEEVIPVLRQQQGARYDDAFVTPELHEAVLNSYWDTPEDAAVYGRTAYLQSLTSLAGVLIGTPLVESFHVSSSTYHKLTANRRADYKYTTWVEEHDRRPVDDRSPGSRIYVEV